MPAHPPRTPPQAAKKTPMNSPRAVGLTCDTPFSRRPTVSTTATRIGTISLVTVPTPDVDRAIAFYESLRVEKRTDIPFGGQYRWVEGYPPVGTPGIAL